MQPTRGMFSAGNIAPVLVQDVLLKHWQAQP